MKSAERYKYEANCNTRRETSFARTMGVTAVLSIPAEIFFNAGLYLLLVTSAATVGWTTSRLIASIKSNISFEKSTGNHLSQVTEEHRRTRRTLYRAPKAA